MAEESKQEPQRPIILEIVAEDQHDVDPVAIGEVGRGILDEVKQDGFAVEPVYTGQRGGLELLFEVFNAAQTMGQVVWADVYAQRDTIGVISSLVTIFGAASPVVKKVFQAREKHEAKQAMLAAMPPAQEHTVKISIAIDDKSITVENADIKDADAILELAKKFHAAYPNVKATPQSQVKIQASVPKKPQRRRR